MHESRSDHGTFALIVKSIGLVQILIGSVAAYYGPLENYVFYLFSEGGRFHYEGFGVGSVWFAALVAQNISYYVLAALLIPVGIGTLKLRRWALALSQRLLWSWLVIGAWLLIEMGILIPAFLRLDLERATIIQRLVIAALFLLISGIGLPAGLLRFYRRPEVLALFEQDDSEQQWVERYPRPLQALLLLCLLCLVMLHLAIFFQGIFPLFGEILWGRPSVRLIAMLIVVLVWLIYGLLKLELWAWWGSLTYFSLLTISSWLTFTRHSLVDILDQMRLPAYEVTLLEKVTILPYIRLAPALILPLLMTLGLIIYSRGYFQRSE